MDFSKLGLDEKTLTDKQKQEIIKKQKEVDDAFEELKKLNRKIKKERVVNKMRYWCLKLDNYEGENDVIYFENYEIAKKNFDIICEKHKEEDEFEQEEDECSWFDCGYNEYSTYVQLLELPLPVIYNEIIF